MDTTAQIEAIQTLNNTLEKLTSFKNPGTNELSYSLQEGAKKIIDSIGVLATQIAEKLATKEIA